MGRRTVTALDDTLDDLAGFDWIPGIAQICDGVRALDTAARTGQLTADGTQTALTLLANPNNPDLPALLAALAQSLTNPTTNRALAGLPDEVAKKVQHLGEMHAYETAEYAPRDHPNEAAGLIYEHDTREGRCDAMTDQEKEALSKKVKEVNERSENRPR